MKHNELHFVYLVLLALSWFGFSVFAENSAWAPGLAEREVWITEKVEEMRLHSEDLSHRLGSMQVVVDSGLAWRYQRNVCAGRLRDARARVAALDGS